MGVHIQTQITPYIKVTGDRTRTVIEEKKSCPDHSNEYSTNDAFCKECGKKIELIKFEKKKQLNPLSFLWDNEIDENSLYSPGHLDNILIPNCYPPFNIKIEDMVCVDIVNPNDIREEQIKWMKNQYSKEIKLLQQEFGEKNIVLSWGVISYYS